MVNGFVHCSKVGQTRRVYLHKRFLSVFTDIYLQIEKEVKQRNQKYQFTTSDARTGMERRCFGLKMGQLQVHLILLISGFLGQTLNFLNRHNVAGRKVLAI